MDAKGCVRSFLVAVAALALFSGAAQAGDFQGVPGLTVQLSQSSAPVGSPATTDLYGKFVFSDIPTDKYTLEIGNGLAPDDALALKFPLDATVHPPASNTTCSVFGQVANRADLPVGYLVKARVFTGGVNVVTPRIVPNRWHPSNSRGDIKVVLLGTNLDMVSKVTLSNLVGATSSTDVVLDPSELSATATFTKADVYANLVPAHFRDGRKLPVDVIVEAAGNTPQIYHREVILLR